VSESEVAFGHRVVAGDEPAVHAAEGEIAAGGGPDRGRIVRAQVPEVRIAHRVADLHRCDHRILAAVGEEVDQPSAGELRGIDEELASHLKAVQRHHRERQLAARVLEGARVVVG